MLEDDAYHNDWSPIECAPTSTSPTFARKSAVLGPDGGFSFADLQHPPKSQSAIFRAGVESLKSGNLVTSAALKNWKCPMVTPRSFNRRCPFTISAPSKF